MYLSIRNNYSRMKRKTILSLTCLGLLLFSACNSENTMEIEIVDRFELEQIPSASGIEHVGDRYFVIGDNSPWLFELHSNYFVLNKYQISSKDSIEGEIIPKKWKSDFEAMTSLKWENEDALFIFGSGSKSPQRNSGMLIKLNDKLQLSTYDLTLLYELIMEEANLSPEELNIEAAAVLGSRLYLFNRWDNKIISMKTVDFQKFINNEKEKIKLKVVTIDLPEIDGIDAGFSGACADEKFNRIIFTASVENTNNSIDDGAVLGSFIGVLDKKELIQHFQPECELLTQYDETMTVKVESVTLKESMKKSLNCVLVTDSDGMASEVLELKIKL